jgi:hypothetical protein
MLTITYGDAVNLGVDHLTVFVSNSLLPVFAEKIDRFDQGSGFDSTGKK